MTALNGKVAVVTGAGRGIGKQIALGLAKSGASVVVNDVYSEPGALETVNRILNMNGSAVAVKADISSLEGVGQLMRQAVDAFGRIDILVNNAAVDPTEDFLEVTESFWDRVVDTNLKGAFFCAQAGAREMIKSGYGKIINISSVHGTLTMPRYAVYAATKGGVNAMTRQLALDLAKYNIQVNAVAPGATEVEKLADNPLHDKAHIGSLIPLGRIGYPEDVANVVTFLASPEADYVTGQIITVDGGSSTRFFLY